MTPRITASALLRLAAVLLVLLACFALSAPANTRKDDPTKPVKPPKTGKLAKTGEIQITTPATTDPVTHQVLRDPVSGREFNGIYPLRYDGEDSGFTSPDGILIVTDKTSGRHMVTSPKDTLIKDVRPDRHTIEITMPDGKVWTKDIIVEAGHRYCIGVTYKNSPKHCWDYPLTANIASVSRDGDIITLTSNVNYSGDIAPTYLWTVSSPNVKFVSGTSSSSEIQISTAEASGTIRVTLGVSVDDGSGNPSCMKEDVKEFCVSTPIAATITISPDSSHFTKGDKVTFVPQVNNYTGTRPLDYSWATEPSMPFTVNQTDHSITVDTTGLPQRILKARLVVKEVVDNNNNNDAACPPVEAQKDIEAKFDECTNCTMNDIKARLDDLGIAVQNEPGSKALVYVHGPLMKARTVGAHVQSYLVNTRGLSSNLVQVEPIADSNVVHIELWTWKMGTTKPLPNINEELKRPQPNPNRIQHIPGSTRRTRGRR